MGFHVVIGRCSGIRIGIVMFRCPNDGKAPHIIIPPTGNLDTRTSYEIMDIFQQLNEQGKTILIVTHEPDIAAMCSRNIVFKDGRIVKDFAVEQMVIAADELAQLPVESIA